ncbi:MAG: ABC transporter permease [Caldilineaceae bacterium]|nr:ABC transporter permease [Caldilineaceae bacterium]
MLLVSAVLFFLLEVAGGDVTVRLLGVFATPAQRDSLRRQLGLDAPAWQRYLDWLAGSDWRAQQMTPFPLVTMPNPQTGEPGWWAVVDDTLTRWRLADGELIAMQRTAEGEETTTPAGDVWTIDDAGNAIFWGVDVNNNLVKWVRGSDVDVLVLSKAGVRSETGGPQQYIPLRKGILRGDAGMSLQTNRPVSSTVFSRAANSLILAGAAFLLVMPLALVFGVLAGVNEGKLLDRIITITGLGFTATPEFVIGVFLILIFGIWLRWLPATAVFLTGDAIFRDPKILVLPVLTLMAAEFGYVSRITRASMAEVMQSPYIRAAFIKGVPRRRVIFRHALRNALLAPITVIMLQINWLIGGVIVVEVLFGIPGLGAYIYDAATFGDFNAVAAAAMLTVFVAVLTRLIGDMLYTYLNPRIRFA